MYGTQQGEKYFCAKNSKIVSHLFLQCRGSAGRGYSQLVVQAGCKAQQGDLLQQYSSQSSGGPYDGGGAYVGGVPYGQALQDCSGSTGSCWRWAAQAPRYAPTHQMHPKTACFRAFGIAQYDPCVPMLQGLYVEGPVTIQTCCKLREMAWRDPPTARWTPRDLWVSL